MTNIKLTLKSAVAFFILLSTIQISCKTSQMVKQLKTATKVTVPEGFSVELVGRDFGSIRHITVADDGTIYANRSKDNRVIGTARGTEVLVKKEYLYMSSNSAIYRYKIDEN